MVERWYPDSKRRADAYLARGFAVLVLLPLTAPDPPDTGPSAQETTRAGRFHKAQDARAHLLGRCTARYFLGIRPAKTPFLTTKSGKPYHSSARPFSISHAGGYVALAIAPAGAVGVDIEARPETWDPAELQDVVCHENEKRWLASLPDGVARKTGFLQIWTRKEALLKAQGTGLVNGLDRLDTRPETPIANLEKFRVYTLSQLPLACAIAVPSSLPGVKTILPQPFT